MAPASVGAFSLEFGYSGWSLFTAALERESAKDGKKMGEMTLAEMDHYWERAKTA